MINKTIDNYDKYYSNIKNQLFPQEWIVRIFMGEYPNLNIKNDLNMKKILEVSCGDGRNFLPLMKKNMDIYATEVTENIITNLQNIYPDIKFKQALNSFLPWEKESFDFLLSWNSMYYMGRDDSHLDFEQYVKEFSKVLKKGALLIASVPMKDNFIFKNSISIDRKYSVITNDPFEGIRNGEIMRKFLSEEDIILEFEKYFKNFNFASSINNHFGIQNNWHIFICEKK